MEYKELEMLWQQYDKKLDNLEKINKRLLKDVLLQSPKKRINRLEFSSLYGLIALPIILLIALHPNLKVENIDWKFILGCIFIFIVLLYLCIENLKTYLILKKMDLSSDTVISSMEKVIKLKRVANNFQKSVLIYYLLIYLGCILVGWNSFTFTTNTIIFLSVLFLATYYLNIIGIGKYKQRINKLEKDIEELREYSEE
ncbi:hypothetical protein [Massilibacteroides vaginae]|uniref:hypothetical protein n=1 Tax=Massilibacteroides vaginae TaxID=1673718 RepID=UPI000A1CBC76|nr:hypothetical protein [Massilibacteroides vaginae]